MIKFGVGTAVALFTLVGHASAQVDEIKVGIGGHDLGVFANFPKVEEAVVLNGEIIFKKPDSWTWRFAPRPYVSGQLNLGGSTSYGGAGLLWRQSLGNRFYSDFGFGLVIHDGTTELELDSINLDGLDIGDPIPLEIETALRDRFFLTRNTKEYGSRILFKPELVLGYRLNDDWAIEGYFEHISHGGLLADGPNDGSDSGGFRIARRF